MVETYEDIQHDKDKLLELNGELCIEIKAKDRLIRGLYADLRAVAPDLARVWARSCHELGGME